MLGAGETALRLAPPPRPSASLRATLTLPPPPTQLSYEGEDAAEPTWDHPHVRQGGWRFERVREGRRLAADIRTVASRRQSAADGARPRLLKRPWEGPERGLRTAWRGGEPPTRMACWSLGGGGGGYSGGLQAQPAWPRPAAGVTQAELLDKLGLVQSPAAGGTGFVEV